MRNAKLTEPLAQRLAAVAAEELVEVVFELVSRARAARKQTIASQSRRERIQAQKEAFARSARPLESAITGAGGEVTGSVWVNKTVRARVPANRVEQVVARPEVGLADLPGVVRLETVG